MYVQIIVSKGCNVKGIRGKHSLFSDVTNSY